MKIVRSCSANKAAQRLRILASLGIIGAGIYYKNWIGLLGIIPLITAVTGSCGLTLQFGGDRDKTPPE